MRAKFFVRITLAVAAVLAAWLALRSGAAPALTAADASTQEIMKLKLGYSQGALQAIAMEDYSLLALNAQKLSKLSHATGWHSRQTPEYQLFTAEFRRHADALNKAARDTNLDAATVAYFQLTLSCVSCHKYMRGVKTVRLNSPGR
ncbi:MAG: hypothetical protein HZA89_11025 [Verrucomicrobia bacterium]|nr:hypothetical protein [Verrucomicrobiota bacterium]